MIEGPNLIKNPGFEEYTTAIDGTKWPNNWTKQTVGGSLILPNYIYPEPGIIGGSCVSIEYPSGNTTGVTRIYQRINIDITKTYLLRINSKTLNLVKGYAYTQLDWFRSDNTYISSFSRSLASSVDWMNKIITVIPNISASYAYLQLGLAYAEGKVSYDDVSFNDVICESPIIELYIPE